MKVLITGGSEGIGLAFAEYYAEINADLILVSKREEKLKEAETILKTYGSHVETIAMDLSEIGNAKILYERAGGQNLDVLINCAGYGTYGRSESVSVEKEERMAVLNDITPMTMSKLFLKDHENDGVLINVCSTGAFQPGPYIAGYYATKAFLLSYTRAIAEERKKSGTVIAALCPGPVATSFYDKSGNTMSAFHETAEETVRCCMKKLGRQTVIIPGWYNRMLRVLPETIRMKAVGIMKGKKR